MLFLFGYRIHGIIKAIKKSVGSYVKGVVKMRTMNIPVGVSDFEEEMLVMLLADNRILDKLLFQMKKEKVQVPLKAIVTAKNQNWTSTALYSEIKREHESMTKAEQAGKKKEEDIEDGNKIGYIAHKDGEYGVYNS